MWKWDRGESARSGSGSGVVGESVATEVILEAGAVTLRGQTKVLAAVHLHFACRSTERADKLSDRELCDGTVAVRFAFALFSTFSFHFAKSELTSGWQRQC